MGLEAPVLQVHREKSGVRGDVDQAERFVEFNAVEQHHLIVQQCGITQMDVAVAFANRAIGRACGQQRFKARAVSFGPGFKGFQLLQVGCVAEHWTDLFEVLPHGGDDCFRGT